MQRHVGKQRLLWLDVLRGLGIFFVCFGHVLIGLEESGLLTQDSPFVFVKECIYSFHMPLFFLLSGLTFRAFLEKRSYKQFLANRVMDIFLVYIFWSVLQSALKISLGGLVNSPKHLDYLIGILTKPVAQFWFLYTLFFLHLGWGLLLKALKHSFEIGFLLGSIALFLIVGSGPYSLVWYSIFFLAGVVMRKYRVNELLQKLCLPLEAVAFFAANSWLRASAFQGSKCFQILTASLGISLNITLSYEIKNKWAVLWAYLGQNSLEIFVLHVILASGARILLLHSGVRNLGLHLLAGLIFGLAGSLFAANLMKKLRLAFLFKPSLLKTL